MEAQDQKALVDAINIEVGKKLDAAKSASNDEITSLKSELEAVKAAKDELKSEVNGEIVKLKAANEAAFIKADSYKTLADQFVDGYKAIIKENGAEKMKKKGFSAQINVKAAGTMTTANIDAVGTNSIPYQLASFSAGLVATHRRRPFIIDLTNFGRTDKMYVQWAEMANNDPGTAGMTSEGGAKTQEDFDVNEKSAKVEKVTAYTKVSLEMLDDVAFMEAEIRNNLIELIALKADAQVLGGNGTTPNLNGITTQSTTYAAGSFAGTFGTAANNFDVLRTAINQVEAANYLPSAIVLHPTDATFMELTKDTTNGYVAPSLFLVSNGVTTFAGIPVIKNTGVTAGTFLLGDFNQVNVRMRQDATISMGNENDDFTKNLITILAEMRLVCYIPSNRVLSLVTGSFSTAKAALNA
jgi:hypothetical protein